VIQRDFLESDPFIMLMDDQLDKQNDEPVGGPHPHAGFETVTLLIEGEIGDGPERMNPGDFQIMTAGSGIIHTETIKKKTRLRVLQLWLTLPAKQRWALPRVQDLSRENVPNVVEPGLSIHVYSGSFAGVSSPVSNYVPLIIADIQMKPSVITLQQLPASFNSFLYVLEGSVKAGEEDKIINQHQVGWLDKYPEAVQSELLLKAGPSGARIVLYAGAPQGDPIVSHGPFIGEQPEDITRLYNQYRQGKMQNISSVAASQRIKL
ncbi:MAG: pirin family protein, partial [Ferruginibacter sp.]|nr:pirin family protein [Chitinophagaceae bacterium]